MSVEIIRKAFCDRCGKACYNIEEKTISEEVCQQYQIKRTRIIHNFYHYTEIALRAFDSRFGEGEKTTLTLCGCCANDFGKWLTPPTEERE